MEKIIVIVERKGDKVVMGRMVGGSFNYSEVPEGVSGMRIVFESWFKQQMEANQPGVEYEIKGADEVWS